MLTTKTITKLNEFSNIEDHWRLLSDKDPKATLFNSFAWVEAWIKFYWKTSYQLKIIIVESGDRPVALLPLYFCKDRNVYSFLGSGEDERSEVASEYLDIIIDVNSSQIEELYDFLAEHLAALPCGSTEFVNCVNESHIHKVANRISRSLCTISGLQFKLDLTLGYDQLFQGFSENFRKKSRSIINRFEKADELDFKFTFGEDYERNWTRLRELHTKNWHKKGKPGAFSTDTFNEFHKYMHVNHPDIQQWYSSLTSKEEIIAINHYYKHGDTLHFYLTGAEKELYPRLSPGLLLHALCIKGLSKRALCYDFMKGSVNRSYKGKFCAPSGEFFTIRIYGSSLSAYVNYLHKKLRLRISAMIRR